MAVVAVLLDIAVELTAAFISSAEQPVSWTPIEPEATPALTRSLRTPWAEAVGPTVIPVALPAVALPIVAPASVTVIEVPAAKLASAATVSTRLAAPGVPAVRVVGAAVTAAVPMKPLG